MKYISEEKSVLGKS